MAITADKNAKGELTGRFRVELQRGKERYRQRHDTFQAAKEDEGRVKALWEAGQPTTAPNASQGQSTDISIATGIALATDILWRNKPSEGCNWAHVRVVSEVLGPDTPLDAIDTAGVRKVLQHLVKAGKSDGTANRYISNLRTFLAWNIAEGNRKAPLDAIVWDWRKETKGRMRWLTFAEEAKLLTLVPADIAKLIRVAIATGCRREELMAAKASQITDDAFYVPGDITKNDDDRTVPLDLETATLLRELVGGEMPSKRTLRRRWDKAKAAMGLQDDKEFVFHICRHTCATRMVEAGIDVLVIKQWLGHKRIETTQRYAKVTTRKLHAALGPLGELRAQAEREAQTSAVSSLPHTPPTTGVIDEMALAA